jgi:hypothetical protein
VLERALRTALSPDQPDAPLLLYLAGHGEPAERPADTAVVTWGNWRLTPFHLASLLDELESDRPVRLVTTTCFGGGFAELAFHGADPAAGSAATLRCGLFATSWDLEASGCDPNPDRRAQRGFPVTFLHALEGADASGQPLPSEAVDFDGNGQVSLLEAHGYGRIHSRSIDVPTTTSERWLRTYAPADGPKRAHSLPTEEAVRDSLAEAFGISTRVQAEEMLELERREAERRAEIIAQARAETDERFADLRTRILARFPVVDDPWHPEFDNLLEAHGQAVARILDGSNEARLFRAADEALAELVQEDDAALPRLARLERVVRAYETLDLAGRLRAQGGPAWERFVALRACEDASLEGP